MSLLKKIADKTKQRVIEEKKSHPLSEIRRRAESINYGRKAFRFEESLKEDDISFICELKQASPSGGILVEKYPYMTIARKYEEAGVAAISCLTEPYWYKGSDKHLEEIAARVHIPVLRQDFVVDEYMIYTAKALGASAVLLICSILTDSQLADYKRLADELGMSALIETRTEAEVERALKANARVIGVNNRSPETFRTDIRTSLRLRKAVPDHVLFVSESGIRTADDVSRLREGGADAILIGEALMRAPNKKAAIRALRGY